MQLTQPFAGDDWQLRAMRMAHQAAGSVAATLASALYTRRPRVWLVSETPDNWFTDKGMDSKNAGDIQKLYWFVGSLVGAMQAQADNIGLNEIWTAIPKAWKGQTPKRVMVDRAMKQLNLCGIYPEKRIPDDAAEAVLLARIGASHFRSKIPEGKGWVRIWSREWQHMADMVRMKLWIPNRD